MNDSLGNMGKLESSISKQIGHLSSAGNINLPNYVADQKHDSNLQISSIVTLFYY
jgi:hypothetical protein